MAMPCACAANRLTACMFCPSVPGNPSYMRSHEIPLYLFIQKHSYTDAFQIICLFALIMVPLCRVYISLVSVADVMLVQCHESKCCVLGCES